MQLHKQHIHGRTAESCRQQNHGSIQAAELWKHANSRTMEACKQQNYGSMQAAEPWNHASSRAIEACKQQSHGTMKAAELWKHASSRIMEACKQQKYWSMQAAELKHASSRTMDCSSIELKSILQVVVIRLLAVYWRPAYRLYQRLLAQAYSTSEISLKMLSLANFIAFANFATFKVNINGRWENLNILRLKDAWKTHFPLSPWSGLHFALTKATAICMYSTLH